jgi:hypothetical protein
MSCLFDSLSSFTNVNSFTLRNQICDYLERNGPIIENLETKTLLDITADNHANYINRMRQGQTWGGGIEISAMCNLYNVKVIVNILQTGKQIEFLPINNANSNANILYISWSGSHYTPVSSLKFFS